MNHLYGLSYSPWTEKARWALDHHCIPYRYHEHLMIFGMPVLRVRLGRVWGDVTVPALISGKIRLTDSFDIAQYADHIGHAGRLFPKEYLEEIRDLNAISETALNCARALLIYRMEKDPRSQGEALGFVPKGLRPPLRWLAKIGMAYVAREFHVKDRTTKDYEEEYHKVLTKIRKRQKQSRGPYLFEHFSYGDIAAAVALQGVEPVADEFLSLGPATRQVWRHPRFAKDFSDLISWRDKIYRTHRHP